MTSTQATTTTSTAARSPEEIHDLTVAVHVRSLLLQASMLIRSCGMPTNPQLAAEILTQIEGESFGWDTTYGSIADSLSEYIGDFDPDEGSDDAEEA